MSRLWIFRMLGMLGLLGLPMLGVVLLGDAPITQYLEFPPQTRYVEHAPFCWWAFCLLAAGIAAVCLPFVVRVLRADTALEHSSKSRGSWPRWTPLALLWTALAWIVAWTRLPALAWFQPFTFSPLWFGYIACVSAITHRRTGRSHLTHDTVRFLLLFPLSAGFWWFFEYLNRFVQNWFYYGVQGFTAMEYFWYATLPFSTVLPAVMATHELLWSFPGLRAGLDNFLAFRLRLPKRGVALIGLLLAGAGLFLIGIIPNLLFPLLWISPLLILVSIDVLAGGKADFSEVARGDWADVAMLALAGLVCGWFWEMWNYFSLARWEYAVPFVQRFEIWEMPVLGYAGYIPFGLECAVIARWVLRSDQPRKTSSSGRSENGGLLIWFLAGLALLVIVLLIAFPLVMQSRLLPPMYERATGYNRRSAFVGPNVFQVEAVVRGDGIGQLLCQDGWGADREMPSGTASSRIQEMAHWMDTANIHFSVTSNTGGPGQYDILETRIFDSATGELLGQASDAIGSGWGMIDDGVLQVRSAGALLPDQVDVWFRLQSYEPGDSVYRLGNSPGASILIDEYTIRLKEMRQGFWSYKQSGQDIRWMSKEGEDAELYSMAILQFDGKWPGGRLQIAVLDHEGKKAFPSFPHYLGEELVDRGALVIVIPMPVEKVSALEIRPFGGRNRFFFQGIELPKRNFSPSKLGPPITFRLTETPGETVISEDWAPVECRLTVYDGDPFSGGFAGDAGMALKRRPSPEGLGEKATLEIRVVGIALHEWILVVRDREGALIAGPGLHETGSGTVLSRSSDTLISRVIDVPVDQIGSVELFPVDASGGPQASLKWLGSNLGRNQDRGVQLLAAQIEAGGADEVLETLESGFHFSYKLSRALLEGRRGLTGRHIDRITRFLMHRDDANAHDNLLNCILPSADTPEGLEALLQLASSSKPWLWVTIIAPESAFSTMKKQTDLPEVIRRRAVALGMGSWFPEVSLDENERAGILESAMTPQALNMDWSTFSRVFRNYADGVDIERGTRFYSSFLTRLIKQWDDWKVPQRANYNGFAVAAVARQLNSWHGINLGGLGDGTGDRPEPLRDYDWKALALSILEWMEEGVDPSLLPAGWAPIEGDVRFVWRNVIDPELSVILVLPAADIGGAPRPESRLYVGEEFLYVKLTPNSSSSPGKCWLEIKQGFNENYRGERIGIELDHLPIHMDFFRTGFQDKIITPGSWELWLEPAHIRDSVIRDTELYARWLQKLDSDQDLPRMYQRTDPERLDKYLAAIGDKMPVNDSR